MHGRGIYIAIKLWGRNNDGTNTYDSSPGRTNFAQCYKTVAVCRYIGGAGA